MMKYDCEIDMIDISQILVSADAGVITCLLLKRSLVIRPTTAESSRHKNPSRINLGRILYLVPMQVLSPVSCKKVVGHKTNDGREAQNKKSSPSFT